MDNTLLIEKIIKLSKDKNIFPTNACIEAGVGKSFISTLRNGIAPSIGKIRKLSDYFGVSTSELLGEAPPTPAEADAQFARELAAADPKTQEIMKQFLKLNKKGRAEAWEYISYQLQKQEKDK